MPSDSVLQYSSDKNTFDVLNAVQIQQPLKQPRTTASCCTWFRSTQLTQKSVAQLHLDRAACVACDTIRSRRCHRCSFCKSDTPTRVIPFRTVDNLDTRMQRPRARPPFTSLFKARKQCHQVTPRRQPVSKLPHPGHRYHRARQAATLRSSQSFFNGHPTQHRARSLVPTSLRAEVPNGSDRNAELKLRLQLWEAGEISFLIGRVSGQQHSGPLRRRKTTMQPQTYEQR